MSDECSIKGCTRTVYKGFLCRPHYALVPYDLTMTNAIDVMHAQRDAARKGHRKQLAAVRAQLRAAQDAGQFAGPTASAGTES